ncbi:hypothetical protein QVD17_27733 [Tagetes erecta]|uniref:Caffeoyl-CoA O-methyltransferase n=1 Tax=Tagetes erecta TaxID=13708 RepID=A0AAD8K9S3_TARER|nr:hypothetical protein QVD17_27733 [Tagetes erecta]
MEHKGLLKSDELYKYIMETNVYPQEPEPLKEIRALTASHQKFFMGSSPDAGQMIEMLLKLTSAKKTLEIGVYTGYSLLLTALTIPEDGKIVAIDINRGYYEIGRPVIEKAGVEHKIDFIQSDAIQALDKLLEDVNGIIVYDNTLWYGFVAKSEDSVPEVFKKGRINILKFNKALVDDPCVKISTAPLGDGITICRRVY